MVVVRMIIAAALLTTPIAAFAQTAAAAVPIPTTATKSADPDKLICKTLDQLGSRIQTRRTCATAAQWKEYEFRAGEWNERMSSKRWMFGGG